MAAQKKPMHEDQVSSMIQKLSTCRIEAYQKGCKVQEAHVFYVIQLLHHASVVQ